MFTKDPSEMTEQDRYNEIAEILALGLQRWIKQHPKGLIESPPPDQETDPRRRQ